MTQFENNFKQIVDAVHFDDTPSENHRRQLEEKLLAVYDLRQNAAPALPAVFYLRKVAIAAGIIIGVAILFRFFDGQGLSPHSYPAHAPDAQTVEHILNQENVTEAERPAILAEIQQTWKLINEADVEGLTAVVLNTKLPESLRNWAGRYLASFGSEETLGILEKYIEMYNLENTDDPVVLAATGLKWFLDNSRNTQPADTSKKQ
jgi:hypothetical protein